MPAGKIAAGRLDDPGAVDGPTCRAAWAERSSVSVGGFGGGTIPPLSRLGVRPPAGPCRVQWRCSAVLPMPIAVAA